MWKSASFVGVNVTRNLQPIGGRGGGCIGGVIGNWPKGVISFVYLFCYPQGGFKEVGVEPNCGVGFWEVTFTRVKGGGRNNIVR